jgi:2-desacetyl-2-hydroxyethyl bacteriochlorophyllide A dehydrogenase
MHHTKMHPFLQLIVNNPFVGGCHPVNMMKALVYHGPGDLRLESRSVPTPAQGEVLIKVKGVSICGSDLGAYRLHEVSDRWQPPIVLGHEFSGEIAGFGEGVQNFSIGQPVTANPILYCGTCYYCQHGLINLCPNRFSVGTSIGGVRHDGAMQEFLTVRSAAVIPLLEGVTFKQGALMEPLAVSLCAAKMGDMGESERVAIIGAGPIGLMILKFLKAGGNKTVFVSDVLPSRLNFAKSIGADEVIDGHQDVAAVVRGLTDNVGADRIIVAAGVPGILDQSFQMVRNGGKIVLVALIHQKAQLELIPIVSRQISLLGSYMFTDEIHKVMTLVAQEQVMVDDLLTSELPLDEGIDAFKELCRPDCTDIKVLLTND